MVGKTGEGRRPEMPKDISEIDAGLHDSRTRGAARDYQISPDPAAYGHSHSGKVPSVLVGPTIKRGKAHLKRNTTQSLVRH